MIKLVALDMDGTLMGDDLVISQTVRDTIATAQQRGAVITLATGRMYAFVVPFARDLGITAPVICYQGGLVQAPDAEEPLYRATMERAVARQVLAWQAENGWHMVFYAGDDVFLDQRRRSDAFYRDLVGEQLVWVDDFRPVAEQNEPVKFVLIAQDVAEADMMETTMREQFGRQMEVVRSHALFVEANPMGVSKGNALAQLAAHLDVEQSQVMAIGDQGNDATMITWAGVGVAMGNASPTIKAVADWIAPSLEEDGAAVAMRRFVLAVD